MLLTMMTGWVVGAPEPLDASTDAGRVVFSCLIKQPHGAEAVVYAICSGHSAMTTLATVRVGDLVSVSGTARLRSARGSGDKACVTVEIEAAETTVLVSRPVAVT
ncbi:hypothetical protein C5C31_13120 [Rathayibacter rathayi]|uniref:Single-stranded DNA-binding protein n=1 Tax=Rathayibacter rathayi TaxID=33887 RepID=A0ABX5AAA4_RATRA|nr:hypothetical protein [Rathayibacter rathayi]MWV75895.1 hypothetical protein [Rathayibacter rathayi NCPPB 2980 = VKM Ac-1601]PPF23007.1 hypothetical protein C5C34_10150 [Rathayibacter rathayi]PPF44727.1 hypothetical protein C5C08_12885 [Rathayibacter rathayi]PPF77367.1 hypothetical protein C5C14_12560 [Rathayibacter rathayi]PPG11473.1 hypothetical protein C5C11_12540 [Rathayibacter rathayi]